MSERPTPYSIAICTMVALYSDPSSPLQDVVGSTTPTQVQIDDVEHFLEDCVLRTTKTQKLNVWVPSSLLLKCGMDVVNLLVETLHMASSSIDALIDLMDSLRGAIAEGLVDPVSAHGVYLRQICLGFEELSFESTTLLWQALREELHLLSSEVDFGNPQSIVQHQQQGLSDMSSSTWTWPLSSDQLERHLRQECWGFQKAETKTFEETELEIRQKLQEDPELPAAHFLRFLNCLKHGERVGALDALHQYFDYVMIHHSHSKTDVLQFAAILLAKTHASFGDMGLSRLATDEAVRVAQQSKDAACVAFALGWLYENNTTYYSNGTDGELLRRCVARASAGKLQHLVTGSNLSLARHYMKDHGGTALEAWNAIVDATAGAPTDGIQSSNRPTLMTDSVDEVMDGLARQRLVAAGIWDTYGLPTLSGLSSYVALHCHGNDLISEDVATAIQNIARVALYGSSSRLLSSSTEALHQPNLQATTNPSSCIYAEALRRLMRLREAYKCDMDGVFLQDITLLLHEWAVRRGDLDDAMALGTIMEGYLHPRTYNYTQVLIDINMQKCLLLAHQGQWDKARKITRDLIETCKSRGYKLQHLRLLIQLAHLQLESNLKEFTAALPPLLECLSLADRYNMDHCHATALSLLSKVFLRMRNPKRAMTMIRATLPSLRRQEHVWYQAEAFLTLAKCQLQLSQIDPQANSNNHKNNGRLQAAATELQRCAKLFEKCHDLRRLREVFYLQARVYNSIGNITARDNSSKAFVHVSQYLQSVHHAPCDIVQAVADSSKLEELIERTIPIRA